MPHEKIYVIMVLYNEKIENSWTFKCIKEIPGIDIILCDNSDDGKNAYNEQTCTEYSNVTYINMGGNNGLSKAYNTAIDIVMNRAGGWICLFDDDTCVPKSYFSTFFREKEKNEADIYLPTVYDENGLLSPSIMKRYFCHRAENIGDIKLDEISGINSGMIVTSEIFDDYRYDEEYFLDFIDHAFLRDMRKQKRLIHVLPVRLNQNFAANSTNIDAIKHRFKILKKDLKHFYSQLDFGLVYYNYIILRRKFRIFLNTKDLSAFLW